MSWNLRRGLMIAGVAFFGVATVGAFLWSRAPAPTQPSVAASPNEPNDPGSMLRTWLGDAITAAMPEDADSLAAVMNIESDFRRGLALHNLLAAADQARQRQLLDDTAAIARDDLRYSVQSIIVTRMFDADPDWAAQQIIETNVNDRAHLLAVLFYAWGQRDGVAAVVGSERLPQQLRENALSAALQGNLRNPKPISMDALVEQAADADTQSYLRSYYQQNQPTGDPEQWLEEALARNDLNNIQQAIYAMTDMDPSAAVAKVQALREQRALSPQIADNLLQNAFLQWSYREPEPAWAAAEGHSDVMKSAVLTGMASLQLDRALSLVQSLAHPDETIGTILLAHSQHDPLDALQRLLALPLSASLRESYAPMIVQNLANLDSQQALATVLTFPAGEERDRWVASTIQTLITSNNTLPYEWIDAIQSTRIRADALADVAIAQIYSGNLSMLPRFEDLPSEDRRQAEQRLIDNWATFDALSAQRYVSQLDTQNRMSLDPTQLVMSMAAEAPEAAADYLDQWPQQQWQNAAPALVMQWANKDLGATLNWIRNIDDPLLRDSSRVALINRYAPREASDLRQIVLGIEDSKLRKSAVADAYAALQATHPDAFETIASWGILDDSELNGLQQL